MREFPVLDASPARAAPSRVSGLFTAVVVLSWLAAILCGGTILVRSLHHHARPVVLQPEWFAPPLTTERGFARLEQTDARP